MELLGEISDRSTNIRPVPALASPSTDVLKRFDAENMTLRFAGMILSWCLVPVLIWQASILPNTGYATIAAVGPLLALASFQELRVLRNEKLIVYRDRVERVALTGKVTTIIRLDQPCQIDTNYWSGFHALNSQATATGFLIPTNSVAFAYIKGLLIRSPARTIVDEAGTANRSDLRSGGPDGACRSGLFFATDHENQPTWVALPKEITPSSGVRRKLDEFPAITQERVDCRVHLLQRLAALFWLPL